MEPPYAHFLADESGTVMIEIYGNEDVKVPHYRSTNPLELHLAFVSHNVEADAKRLTAAGAALVGEIQTSPEGDTLLADVSKLVNNSFTFRQNGTDGELITFQKQ